MHEEKKEEIIEKLKEISNESTSDTRKYQISCLIEEIEQCSSDDEAIDTVYEWENEANSYYSRGETNAYFFQKEMFERVSVVLP